MINLGLMRWLTWLSWDHESRSLGASWDDKPGSYVLQVYCTHWRPHTSGKWLAWQNSAEILPTFGNTLSETCRWETTPLLRLLLLKTFPSYFLSMNPLPRNSPILKPLFCKEHPHFKTTLRNTPILKSLFCKKPPILKPLFFCKENTF